MARCKILLVKRVVVLVPLDMREWSEAPWSTGLGLMLPESEGHIVCRLGKQGKVPLGQRKFLYPPDRGSVFSSPC